MDIRFLGAHNCESLNSSCVCLLIDKTLAIDAGGLTSGLSIEEQREINAVVLTHEHLDHIRDIPGIALSLFRRNASIEVYSTAVVCEIIKTHLLNGVLYPEFHKIPAVEPTVVFRQIETRRTQWIDGHKVLPVPVNHVDTSVGYEISDIQGKTVFFTGDTGPGLSECWQRISPQLLVIDVTLPNGYENYARKTGHLTPDLLQQELVSFRMLKGYVPRVIAVHMDASLEPKICEEITAVSENMDVPIIMAYEGMQLSI